MLGAAGFGTVLQIGNFLGRAFSPKKNPVDIRSLAEFVRVKSGGVPSGVSTAIEEQRKELEKINTATGARVSSSGDFGFIGIIFFVFVLLMGLVNANSK